MQTFFKIIIPNYNNGNYLKRCLDSVLNQTFKDYICIIIDDLSNDNSLEIIREYTSKDSRFILLQNFEKLYGASRNRGLDFKSEAKFNIFIDSDDFILTNDYFQKVYNELEKYYFNVDVLWVPTTHSPNPNTNIKWMMQRGASPWKYVVNSKFDNIHFSKLPRCNDIVWFLTLMDTCEDSKIIPMSGEPFYQYNKNSDNSNSNDKNINSNLSIQAEVNLRNLLNTLEFKKPLVKNRVKIYVEKECIKSFKK